MNTILYKVRLFFKITLISLLFFTCSSPKKPTVTLDPSVSDAQTYHAALNTWTRSKEIYKLFVTKAYLKATYRSPEFRKSYQKEFFSRLAIELEQQDIFIQEDKKEQEENIVFVLAAYIPDFRKNDFHKSNSIWHIKLKDDSGKVIYPHTVSLMNKNIQKNLMLYPHVSHWDKVYEIRFSAKSKNKPFLSDSTKYIELVIAGLQTNTTFRWKL